MALKAYQSGAWQDISTLKHYSSSAWQEAQSANKYISSAWQEVWSAGLYLVKNVIPDTTYIRNWLKVSSGDNTWMGSLTQQTSGQFSYKIIGESYEDDYDSYYEYVELNADILGVNSSADIDELDVTNYSKLTIEYTFHGNTASDAFEYNKSLVYVACRQTATWVHHQHADLVNTGYGASRTITFDLSNYYALERMWFYFELNNNTTIFKINNIYLS